MTDLEKLTALRSVLGIDNFKDDETLRVYLNLAAQEILTWQYSASGGVPTTVTSVPRAYEITQIMACAAGFGKQGGNDELQRTENGVVVHWKHADMVSYVRDNVTPLVGFGTPAMGATDDKAAVAVGNVASVGITGSIGALTVDVANADVASASVSGAIVTLTGLSAGSTFVYVSDEKHRVVALSVVVTA